MARPKKHNIDPEQVEKLAALGCNNSEIASFFNCSESLIRKSYSEFLTKGRDTGKIKLRQMQWKAAQRGSVPMLIWLGKQGLAQTDKQEITEVKPIDEVIFDGI